MAQLVQKKREKKNHRNGTHTTTQSNTSDKKLLHKFIHSWNKKQKENQACYTPVSKKQTERQKPLRRKISLFSDGTTEAATFFFFMYIARSDYRRTQSARPSVSLKGPEVTSESPFLQGRDAGPCAWLSVGALLRLTSPAEGDSFRSSLSSQPAQSALWTHRRHCPGHSSRQRRTHLSP